MNEFRVRTILNEQYSCGTLFIAIVNEESAVKWGNLFLIKLCPDNVINESAETYREWEKVPDNQKWADEESTGWQRLENRCFKGQGIPTPTLQDKIMIIAHGSTTHVGTPASAVETPGGSGYDAHELATWLAAWGIEEIGLLTFKCCYVGAGSFLEDFVRHLPKKKLKVGWVKGYKGPASTIKRSWWEVPVIGGVTGKPYESIGRDTGLLSTVGIPAYADDRFKIVRGNAAMNMPNSRFAVANFREVGD